MFFSNIRYKEDGKLVDYDNEIVDINNSDKEALSKYDVINTSKYKYVNKSSDNKVYFSDNIEDGLVLNHGKYVLKMTPINTKEDKNVTKSQLKEDLIKEQSINTEDNKKFKFIKSEHSNEVKYKSEPGDIEYQYIVKNNGVKENIIINEKPNTNIFEYKIDTKNLYLKQQYGDKGLSVCDKKTDKTIGIIQPPFLVDSERKEDYLSVEYKLQNDEKDTKLRLIVDEKYFENENIKYPVTIDPTMLWQFDYLSTAMVWSVDFRSDANIQNSQLTSFNKMMDGYPYNTEQRVYLDTTNLLTGNALMGSGNSIVDKYIESASLRLFECTYPNYYTPGIMQLRNAMGSWDPNTITWNNQPRVSSDVIVSEEMSGSEGEEHILDITNWAQSIADGSQPNNGLVFTCVEGDTASFYGPEPHYISDGNGGYSGIRHMSISLVYRDLEPYDATINLNATYDEQSDKFQTTIEDENQLEDGVTITGYKIFTRKDTASKFHSKAVVDDISESAEIDASNVNECIDLRVCVLYSDGKVKVSNIVTFEKQEHDILEGETSSQEENAEGETTSNSNYTFEITTKDTDGDGLEDGYEVWDFHTLWNKQTSESTTENPQYNIDSDNDGFPDGYEVFTLGTDPAVANESGTNSDGDNWTDLREYQEGTDPWLRDSDFDGLDDSQDIGTTNPRKTDNLEKRGTDKEAAHRSTIHIGKYDVEVERNIKGASYRYIKGIYNGLIRKVIIDYNDNKINKTLLYYYDNDGNNTAIVKKGDEDCCKSISGETCNHTKCITYWREEQNITYICDCDTIYDIEYNEDEIESFSVNGREIVYNSSTIDVNNIGNESSLNYGDVVFAKTNSINYGNGQNKNVKTYNYKVDNENSNNVSFSKEIYFDNSDDASYKYEYNSQGELIRLLNYTHSISEPIEYNYYANGNVTSNDGYSKNVSADNNDDTIGNSLTTTYNFSNSNQIKSINHSSTSKSDNIYNIIELYGKDKYERNYTSDRRIINERIYSDSVRGYIINSSRVINNNGLITKYWVQAQSDDDGKYITDNIKNYFDKAGNLTKTEQEYNQTAEYIWNSDGQVIEEYDYKNQKYYEYEYNWNGKIINRKIYNLESNSWEDKQVSYQKEEEFEYDNNGLLVEYINGSNNSQLTYDSIGNPINYIGGKVLSWTRGQLLSRVDIGNLKSITYEYNDMGKKVKSTVVNHNDNNITETNYYWDGNKVIKEKRTTDSSDQISEIWYLYDDEDNIVGYDYVEITDDGEQSTRIYFQKDINDSIIGMWTDRGKKVASYSYDILGNIISSDFEEEYETACMANHIMYKGYYYDYDISMYYADNRYYDSTIGSIINYNDVSDILNIEKNKYDLNMDYNGESNNNYPILDDTGYEVAYEVDSNADCCQTSNMFFESLDIYNTNCYGFAINCWTYKEMGNINPGMNITGQVSDEYQRSCWHMARFVRQDFMYWGENVTILTGNNNNPNYVTDEDHYLIALRTCLNPVVGSEVVSDTYHFMVRKKDGWYFKGGWRGGIFKLTGNNTPDTVDWVYYSEDNGLAYPVPFFYDSEIQYIVVPKRDLLIK